MPPDPRSALVSPPADRRAAILRAAATVMARDGHASASIKEIAAEAGVAAGLVHYYFASKDELMVAVAGQLCDEVTDHWIAAGDGVTDPIERIDAALRYVQALRRERPEFYRLIFDLWAAGLVNAAIREPMVELWRSFVALIEAELLGLFASLDVPVPGPPHELASGLAAAIDGVALLSLATGEEVDGDYVALKAMVVSMVISALVAAGKEVPLERLRPLLGDAATTGAPTPG